jgi:hypothetical protein
VCFAFQALPSRDDTRRRAYPPQLDGDSRQTSGDAASLDAVQPATIVEAPLRRFMQATSELLVGVRAALPRAAANRARRRERDSDPICIETLISDVRSHGLLLWLSALP